MALVAEQANAIVWGDAVAPAAHTRHKPIKSLVLPRRGSSHTWPKASESDVLHVTVVTGIGSGSSE
jgi:hypothetical protein